MPFFNPTLLLNSESLEHLTQMRPSAAHTASFHQTRRRGHANREGKIRMFLRMASAVILLEATAVAAGADTGPSPRPAAFSGPYAGASIGGVRTDGRATLASTASPAGVIDRDVTLGIFPSRQAGADTTAGGGLTLGYDMQRDRFVGGVALGLNFGRFSAENTMFGVDPAPFGFGAGQNPFGQSETTTRYGTRIGGLATMLARAGVVADRTLFYVTGGLAAGRVRNRFDLRIGNLQLPLPDAPNGVYSNSWSESGTRLGYAVGGGVEHRISTRTSLQLEFLHFDLRDVTVQARDPANFGGESIAYRFRNSGQVARIAINFRF
ncbi:MAG TPA: outer membrane beta-barrel protein [Burkholderiales bacterium]|nr:outer membrane beta-barrel protein [Burkholderiales bacterium]